jgi:hypothetical protein
LDKHPDKPGSYIINEREADQVREIFRIFLNTGSRAKTIQELEEKDNVRKQHPLVGNIHKRTSC